MPLDAHQWRKKGEIGRRSEVTVSGFANPYRCAAEQFDASMTHLGPIGFER